MKYYDLRIDGKDVKRFIRNLHKMHINFYKIRYIKDSVVIKVNDYDYKKIKDIKTIYDIKIIRYYGLARIENFIKKYKIFLITLLFGFFLFITLTNIIFEVEVIHNDSEIREMILNELKEEGITKYKFVVSYNKKEKIKNNILNKYNDKLEWIEIKRIGTKYVVEVEERKQNYNVIDNTPRNIVAKKNGIITKIVSNHGEIVTKVDQYVKKGDILISGVIHNKEEVVDNIKADGSVYAETWYTVTVLLPYHYSEEEKTGRNEKIIKFKFLNKEINLFENKDFDNYIIKDIYKIKNFLLPISISLEELEETNIKDYVYTIENASIYASEIGKKRLRDQLGEDTQILFEKQLKTSENNSKIEVVMFYKVIEDITDYSEIVEQEENKTEIR